MVDRGLQGHSPLSAPLPLTHRQAITPTTGAGCYDPKPLYYYPLLQTPPLEAAFLSLPPNTYTMISIASGGTSHISYDQNCLGLAGSGLLVLVERDVLVVRELVGAAAFILLARPRSSLVDRTPSGLRYCSTFSARSCQPLASL